MTTAKTPAAVSLAALLALTACSGGSSVVYDFTEPVTEPVSSIEFRVPDELIELEDDYAENRLQESVTVTAVESDDPSQCAVEYRFEYADGALDRLLAHIEDTADDHDASKEERMADILTNESLDDVELSEDYSSAVVPLGCAVSPTDDENTVEAALSIILEDEDRVPNFVRADIAVMQGGELFVHEPVVSSDWQLDSNGNWIQVDD
ncbi:hypothetical protein A6A08_02600 [Nocardiopsis sp. TSRI0078]|uniref:hypothetical protein n=1 Tax=unclassified Nocardiopsis TaxID=2649073 RepID=UPI00093BEDD7|nr:hypothetical protein [Nocardiopsis sp. TSRI0078]OKI23676.1 hypothetical protein A6A08_02600 [Nocardiopsis sp. TSRI0078]